MAKSTEEIPKKTDIDKQIDKALKNKEIRKAYEEYRGNPKDFIEGLKYDIMQENYKNRRLKYAAEILDTANKVTVPVDSAIDASSILLGIGTAVKGIETLAKIPIYTAYDLYYAGKTHDIAGALKNLGYEAISWFTPGSLPHLLKHYQNQANSFAVKKGSEKFLNRLEKKIKVSKNSEGMNLEDLAEAA